MRDGWIDGWVAKITLVGRGMCTPLHPLLLMDLFS